MALGPCPGAHPSHVCHTTLPVDAGPSGRESIACPSLPGRPLSQAWWGRGGSASMDPGSAGRWAGALEGGRTGWGSSLPAKGSRAAMVLAKQPAGCVIGTRELLFCVSVSLSQGLCARICLECVIVRSMSDRARKDLVSEAAQSILVTLTWPHGRATLAVLPCPCCGCLCFLLPMVKCALVARHPPADMRSKVDSGLMLHPRAELSPLPHLLT